MASGASKLETELVAFVEGHPETFDQQDVVNLRRNIIIHFFQIVGPPHNAHPHVISVVKLIMENIQSKVKPINTSQDVKDALELFNLGVSCQTIIKGRGNILMLEPPSPPDYRDNFYSLVKRHVNEYHVKVLKLWADALVRKGKMTPTAIAEMQTRVGAKDGYERKMRELCGNPSGMVWGPPGHVKNNLNESVLLDFLTLFHVATPAQMTAKYDNIGPLDYIVFTIISQFVPVDNVSGIPTGNHETELNLLNLKCVGVMLPPSQSPTPPIFAYLSSDVLDQCVQSVGRFPTADEFNQFVSKQTIEKSVALAAPAPSAPPPSAPALHELDGGKKTRHIMIKKRNHSKKSRHHRR